MDRPLDAKVALVTGAARGQGRGHAIRLGSDGANIIAVDLCAQIPSVPLPMATPDDLATTVNLVDDTGARIVAKQGDDVIAHRCRPRCRRAWTSSAGWTS